MKKKLLSIVLALSMLCAFVPLVASAEVATSGTCGENLTWTLGEDGTLTISGTGDMYDYYNDFFGQSKIKNVIIKNGVTSIGNSAFEICGKLTSIEIPNSVTSIGNRAFNYCRSLTSIKIPNSVKSIGDGAFEHCNNLTSIEIPNSVMSIGNRALSYCQSLTSINVDKDNSKYYSIDGNLFNKDKLILIQYALGKTEKSYIVPNGVTSIGAGAFEYCEHLTSIEIPNSVTSIGADAFGYCKNLTSIKIPTSVTSIGDYAFEYCKNLTSIEIPNSVTSIGAGAFGYCENLISIELPDSVISIGVGAFEYCENLTSIEIPNSVTSIGAGTFEHCENLTSIKIPNGIKNIGDYAFENCLNLIRIEIPNSVTKINERAFRKCTDLTDVYYNGTKKQWNEINIGNYNDDLKNATIHYKRDIPLTTATIKTEKVGEAYTFNVEPEQKYEDCYVYAAMYDENGLLTGFNRVPLETSGSTNISVGKTDNAESAKVFILSDMLQPVIATQEFTLE